MKKREYELHSIKWSSTSERNVKNFLSSFYKRIVTCIKRIKLVLFKLPFKSSVQNQPFITINTLSCIIEYHVLYCEFLIYIIGFFY